MEGKLNSRRSYTCRQKVNNAIMQNFWVWQRRVTPLLLPAISPTLIIHSLSISDESCLREPHKCFEDSWLTGELSCHLYCEEASDEHTRCSLAAHWRESTLKKKFWVICIIGKNKILIATRFSSFSASNLLSKRGGIFLRVLQQKCYKEKFKNTKERHVVKWITWEK